MSKRNSQEAKRAARERLRVEQEKQAKKEKVRRQLVVGGSIVGVLAIAAGIGVAVSNMSGGSGGEGDSSNWSAAKEVAAKGAGGAVKTDGKKVEYKAPDNTSGKNGTDIIIGDKDAKHTLKVYEDMRCPICATFERNAGDALMKDIEQGKYKVSYTFGTFLDGDTEDELSQNGTGSKNALSALGAALNVSPEAFLEYKKALFSKENHPPETEDAFASDELLIEIAQEVDALEDNKKFEKAVNNGTYDAWALKVSQKFRDSDVTGTPTLKLDGTKLVVNERGSPPLTEEQFNALIERHLGKSAGDGGSEGSGEKAKQQGGKG